MRTFDVGLPALRELQEEVGSQHIPSGYKAQARTTSLYTLHRLGLDTIVFEIKTTFCFLPLKINLLMWNRSDDTSLYRLQQRPQEWFSGIAEACSKSHGQDALQSYFRFRLKILYHSATILVSNLHKSSKSRPGKL